MPALVTSAFAASFAARQRLLASAARVPISKAGRGDRYVAKILFRENAADGRRGYTCIYVDSGRSRPVPRGSTIHEGWKKHNAIGAFGAGLALC